jgi:hypothetical protein
MTDSGIPEENKCMKALVLLLLAAGPLALCAQQRTDISKLIIQLRRDSVRFLAPDGMPCRIPDMGKLERMPIQWKGNADPLWNPYFDRRLKKGGHPLYH